MRPGLLRDTRMSGLGPKKPPAWLARCLVAHQLAHNWRTETANRLLMRDRAPRLGMYFI
jgi:hypothetical protein